MPEEVRRSCINGERDGERQMEGRGRGGNDGVGRPGGQEEGRRVSTVENTRGGEGGQRRWVEY